MDRSWDMSSEGVGCLPAHIHNDQTWPPEVVLKGFSVDEIWRVHHPSFLRKLKGHPLT
jgi:hypothetical protein